MRSSRFFPYALLLPVLLLITACSSSQGGETPTPPDPTVLAFPGAEGGGKYATGGRASSNIVRIIPVTSLEDNPQEPGIGTLRYAVQTMGRRIVVFKVAGRIDLKGTLEIKYDNLSILGQSAPGDGICISGYPVLISANNVIFRFLRFRMGDVHTKEADALTICQGNYKNIMIDHCSCSWSTDECLSIYGAENATIQYCYITESLHNSIHEKGAHGYGGIWGGKNTSFHHNLLAHHDSRNPRFDHDYVESTNVGPVDYINNVVYNWGSNSSYGGESTKSTGHTRQYNFVNNYYKAGPITKSHCSSKRRNQFLNPTTSCSYCKGTIVPGLFYLTGNVMDGDATVTADNWNGVHPDTDTDAMRAQCKSSSPFSFTNAYTNYQSAADAYEAVLTLGGCSYRRDTVDGRIVREVRNGTYTYEGSVSDYPEKSYKSTGGIIDSQSDVGGWPEYKSYDVETDTDNDNIPDVWELAHGLDPNNYKDARLFTLDSLYLNLEVYLNDIVGHLYVQ